MGCSDCVGPLFYGNNSDGSAWVGSAGRAGFVAGNGRAMDAKEIIARRVAREVRPDTLVNLGVGLGAFADGAQAADTDGDYVEDSLDNCSQRSNPSQRDSDQDGIGDVPVA